MRRPERAGISPSRVSHIETDLLPLSLENLTAFAGVLWISLGDSDVVIRPERDERRGLTAWLLRRDDGPYG
ncbi:helix-turn-helix domain-containing protein [Streptomyces sp. NPDC001568]|uniref:helix-turn-helix domain-containing protein n=1 Tax=Streptomyces sp. NPDC001568 TaxID=3364588 RepID=UPI0036CB5550